MPSSIKRDPVSLPAHKCDCTFLTQLQVFQGPGQVAFPTLSFSGLRSLTSSPTWHCYACEEPMPGTADDSYTTAGLMDHMEDEVTERKV